MASDAGKSPNDVHTASGSAKIEPKDVASATAIGSAIRVGAGRHKAMSAGGAGAGAAGGPRRSSDNASLMTALLVVGITVGMLAIMIVFSR